MKLIMSNLRAGSSEEFVLGLVKKFKPGKITIIPADDDCRALIEFADEVDAHRAIEHFLGKKNALEEYDPAAADASGVMFTKTTIKSNRRVDATPYSFVERKMPKKSAPTCKHDCLAVGQHYDIAFDVEWLAETPVAANPCTAEGDNTFPANTNNRYQGYAKRWLMIGNRLALSPFTVKSAIANGVASLLGSCYRVMDNKIEGHNARLTGGTYPFTGMFKRYRVGMVNNKVNSKPGILQDIDYKIGKVSIEPVDEYLLDWDGVFTSGTDYFITFNGIDKKIITKIETSFFTGATKVQYFGKYTFGMQLSFSQAQFNHNHYHRFYSSVGRAIDYEVNPINLESCAEQQSKVDMGRFKKFRGTERYDLRPDALYSGKPWHQDLTNGRNGLHKGDWVYFQPFSRGAAIGKNFQFKTAFRHSDAVPVGQDACQNVTMLCPRCSLFGIVDSTEPKTREAAGFKGRFKAAALVSNLEVKEGEMNGEIRYGDNRNYPVILKNWTFNGQEVSRQFLLPIMSGPKPNRRDVGAYYQHGMVAGVKAYRHAMRTWCSLEQLVDGTNLRDYLAGNMPYSHDLRNYAQVCKDGMTFSGTMGAENCSLDEVAALLLLLDRRIARHGFKIGLGRPFGLGSMSSVIKRIWVRKAGNYEWEAFEIPSEPEVSPALPKSLGDIQNEVNKLKKMHSLVMSLNQAADSLNYPKIAGGRYWEGNFK